MKSLEIVGVLKVLLMELRIASMLKDLLIAIRHSSLGVKILCLRLKAALDCTIVLHLHG